MTAPPDETKLTALIAVRDFSAAAHLAIEQYGEELFGFLINFMSNETDAAEVFAQTSEDLWRGLPGFGGRCSMRTWLYLLARHAAARFRRSPRNREGAIGDEQLNALVAEIRTRTSPWLRTDIKDRFRALREALDPDDRLLLVLRVDRDMPWHDIALVTLGLSDPDAAALDRETARLRKRFQLLKLELREQARAAGLLDAD